jgi:hypothetical protein
MANILLCLFNNECVLCLCFCSTKVMYVTDLGAIAFFARQSGAFSKFEIRSLIAFSQDDFLRALGPAFCPKLNVLRLVRSITTRRSSSAVSCKSLS